jgi:hypothetical protein
MTTMDRTTRAAQERFEEAFGPEVAGWLMERLPPERSSQLVTKNDLAVFGAELRAELRAESEAFRAEMRAESEAFRNQMRSEWGEFRSQMRAEWAEYRADTRSGFDGLRVELHRELRVHTMGLVGMMVFLAGLAVAFARGA